MIKADKKYKCERKHIINNNSEKKIFSKNIFTYKNYANFSTTTRTNLIKTHLLDIFVNFIILMLENAKKK